MAFEHFLLGSHNFMVTAFGSCVKWPLDIDMEVATCIFFLNLKNNVLTTVMEATLA